jgi:hypothetical protein
LHVRNGDGGIILLTAPGIFFCRVILQGRRAGIDENLREDQAGFRDERFSTDQTFVLRTVVEQSLEWYFPLHKPFSILKRPLTAYTIFSLWNIFKACGFPDTTINSLTDLYADNKWYAMMNNKANDSRSKLESEKAMSYHL